MASRISASSNAAKSQKYVIHRAATLLFEQREVLNHDERQRDAGPVPVDVEMGAHAT